MRLLLTRAAADAERTRAALEAKGHEVVVSPLLAMVATGADLPVGPIDALIATSAQAFHLGPLHDDLRVPLFVVGERTAEAARGRGYDGPLGLAPTASALAALLCGLPSPPRRAIYLAGRDRKPALENALAALGGDHATVIVYEAREVGALSTEAVAALRAGAIEAVVHFSARSALLFLRAADAAGADVTGLRHACLSDDVAAALRGAGCRAIATAASPDEAALLALL